MTSNEIMVSVVVITYNHEKYIDQTIKGILNQRVSFSLEIIIHDDASTDATPDIIRQYEEDHSAKMVCIYQSENQFSNKDIGIWTHLTFPLARGKYIALCEGDDFWTDPHKLQKQIDFLEQNEDYVICSHNYSTLYSDEDKLTDRVKYKKSFTYDLEYYLRNQVTQTLTACFRNIFKDYSYLVKEQIFTDFFLFFELLKHGKGYYMVDNMATYRVHGQGVASSLSREQYILNHIIMFEHLNKYNPWLIQVRQQLARYYIIHFNFSLKIKRQRWPEWSSISKYLKYENRIQKKTAMLMVFVPYYLTRYWLTNFLR
jgi:glycosyltransferase involved in cell wall biosynthesis